MSQDTENQLHDGIADLAVSLHGPPDAIGIDRKMPLIPIRCDLHAGLAEGQATRDGIPTCL